MMPHVSTTLVRLFGRGAARRLEEAAKDPVAAQLRKLLQICERNRDTEYGREFSFGKVRSLEDWRAAVPVATWEDLRPRVERVVRGEKRVLTAEEPLMFARTSGTTGEPKYIPVTRSCLSRDHKDQTRAWLYYAIHDHPSMLDGKALSLVSPAVEGRTPSGIPFGSTSGHMYRHMPRLVRNTYAVPYEVFEIEDYETKYYAILRLGIGADVTILCTANPSSVVTLCEKADEHADRLLRDVADGTLSRELELPDGVRKVVEAGLGPDPGRAKRLEEARRRRGGKLLPADYWPHLALIGCWKGGTVANTVERFALWFDPDGDRPVPVRDWGYLSSEARGSIPISDEGCGGVLTVGSNVFEFVEAAELEQSPDQRDSWDFLGVDQIEPGKEYYVFFTTTGGLYRYDINDVIEVVDRFHRAPVVAFRRKGRGASNITGEKVTENQVIEAVQKAARETGVTVDHFQAIADVEEAQYVFQVESSSGIPEGVRRSFLEGLERSLSEMNLEYRAKRKSARLHPPVLHVMKPGWHDETRKRDVAQGKRTFQAKTRILDVRDVRSRKQAGREPERESGPEPEAVVEL
jgi:hypothetical protein